MTTRRQLWPATRPIRNTNSTHGAYKVSSAGTRQDPGSESRRGRGCCYHLCGSCLLRVPAVYASPSGFYVGARDLNSAAHTSMPSVLTTALPDLGTLIPVTQAGRQHLSLHSSLPCPPCVTVPRPVARPQGDFGWGGRNHGEFYYHIY